MSRICIEDFNVKELEVYRDYSENQLKHYYEPDTGLFIAETPNVIERAMNAGYVPESFLLEDRFDTEKNRALYERFPDVPVFITDHDSLKDFTGYNITMGILSAMRRKVLPKLEEVCRDARRIAVLYNVENPTNAGAIVRAAAALGMQAVIFTDDCADPLYRRAVRVSVGTVFQIPWTVVDRRHVMEELKTAGFCTAAMALKNDTLKIDDPVLKKTEKLAIVLGSEGYGLPDEITKQCDHTVMIPMYNGVDSLNVASAAAVAFWELGR